MAWIAGLTGTALEGKFVWDSDLGSAYQFKTANTDIASPQGAAGLDPNYPSYMSLVSPQTNPGVDFSAYPAQNACKAMGGRLPNTQELAAMYAGRASYGNNFGANGSFWSATEDGPLNAILVFFWSSGAGSSGAGQEMFSSKSSDFYVRPVKDTIPPTVADSAATAITTTTATGNGNVTSDGSASITERGVCWGASANPTTADGKAAAAGTTGAFTAPMTSLNPGTLYYWRMYATNSEGTTYSTGGSFTTAPDSTLNLSVGNASAGGTTLALDSVTGLETLRIRKRGSSSYSDITSATIGGFSDLVRTQVLNEAGSLTFTLAATAPSIFSDWIDEAATVEYWAYGAKAQTYVIDDYTPHWSALTCDVKCIGLLGLGASPGTTITHTAVREPLVTLLSTIVGAQVAASGTGPQWVWDAGKQPFTVPAVSENFYDAPTALPDSPWHKTGDITATVAEGIWTAHVDQAVGALRYTYAPATTYEDSYQYASITSVWGASLEFGFMSRLTVGGHCYECLFRPTSVRFFCTSGSRSQIGVTTTIAALQAGDSIGFGVAGTTLTAYVNDAAVYSLTDATLAASGSVGVCGFADTGTADYVRLGSYVVTSGAIPTPMVPYLTFVDASLLDAIKAACSPNDLVYWLDAENKLNVEPFRTAVDETYTVNGTLHDFDTTYSARSVVNRLTITSGADVWAFNDATSQAVYGMRAIPLRMDAIASYAQAEAYATAYFGQYAQPRRSANLLVDHDLALRPGLMVEVTGLGDGREYKDLIQQITYRTGDLWDQLVTGTPALALKA